MNQTECPGDARSHGFSSRGIDLFLLKYSWWRHQMDTFSALLAICAGNSPVSGEFPTQRPVTRSFDVFFDLCLNKRLSKQWWGWWFETLSCPLWRHRNGPVSAPGPRFNIKMTSYQSRKSHCGDETILRPSYLYNGISYTCKMTSLNWIRALNVFNFQLPMCMQVRFA